MLPIIEINLGNQSIQLHTYALMLGFAISVAIVFLPVVFLKLGVNLKRSVMGTWFMILISLIFARLVFFMLYPKLLSKGLWQLFDFEAKNFTLYGGVLGALIAIYILSRIWSFSILKWMDHSLLQVSTCLLLSRIGCVLNGCCFGKVTKMPWGIAMKKNSLAYYAYIQDHPFLFFTKLPKIHFTQLYEIIVVLIALCIGYICFFKIRKQPIDGIPAICFGLVLTLGRFVVYFFREFPDASQTSNIIRGPVTYVLALLLLLILLIGRIRIVRRLSLTSVKIESLGNKYFNEEKFEYYENS